MPVFISRGWVELRAGRREGGGLKIDEQVRKMKQNIEDEAGTPVG